MFVIILSFIISFILVAIILPRILLLSLRKRLIDPIDPRKIHSSPASRLGGVTFLPSLLFSMWFCIGLSHLTPCFISDYVVVGVGVILEYLALLSLFLIGIYDDILGVAYRKKFAVQIFAALLFIASSSYIHTLHGLFGIYEINKYLAIPITVFIYVFIINSLNLIDGIDGLASLLSIMALMVYGILLYANGQLYDAILAIASLGALVPFLYHNLFGIKQRAYSKIFMGDTGALVIGAILGILAIRIWNISYSIGGVDIAPIFYITAYTMLIVPCFDVIRVIIHRFRNNKPIFMPDKSHIHHKFMALGFSAHMSLSLIVIINLLFAILNLTLSYILNITIIVIIDIVVWTLMHLYISQQIKLRQLSN
ncbi:MAG: MraY family glycosyltransferase [Rikenellaceae bacterium]